jgi:hypothetical protein
MLMAAFPSPQPPAEDIPIYNGRGCTLLELSQLKCRWPISSPGAEEFCFCGNEPVKGLPYCVGHARIASSIRRPRSRAFPSAQRIKVPITVGRSELANSLANDGRANRKPCAIGFCRACESHGLTSSWTRLNLKCARACPVRERANRRRRAPGSPLQARTPAGPPLRKDR